MASLLQSRPVCSAVRKQATALPFYLQTATKSTSSPSGTCSSFSTLSSQPRSLRSQRPLQSLQRLNSRSRVPTHQCRTFLVQLRRQSQTLRENTPSTGTPSPATETLQTTNLPYFIRRTACNQLPVYLVTKAGGTKQQTKVQKTEGDLDALRADLARYLNIDPKSPDVTINRLNGHIIVKGWRKSEILKFLSERNF
ncbi:mitochondrial large subunit ribosomal protein-domain-containing protein [Aspergillus ambiguus]|uniref:mitochondrial 54S ribosomal protein mL49 n=1 Tax=Aspergillus ambiguus TaxID=176160 RepID=UPI003CCCA962